MTYNQVIDLEPDRVQEWMSCSQLLKDLAL